MNTFPSMLPQDEAVSSISLSMPLNGASVITESFTARSIFKNHKLFLLRCTENGQSIVSPCPREVAPLGFILRFTSVQATACVRWCHHVSHQCRRHVYRTIAFVIGVRSEPADLRRPSRTSASQNQNATLHCFLPSKYFLPGTTV